MERREERGKRNIINTNKIIFVILIAAVIASVATLGSFAASSTNYRISTEVLDAGGARGQSASYVLLGKARERELTIPSSTNYAIREGFLRTAYFAVVLAPIVASIEPTSASNTQEVTITVYGANFAPGAAAKLSLAGEADIIASPVTVESGGKMICVFNITGAQAGLWNVTVTNTDGRSGTLPSAFSITSLGPVISSITPNKGFNNAVINITNLAGNNFNTGAAVKLSKAGQSDIAGTGVVVESAVKITCSFDLLNKATGLWDVVVTNPDTQYGTLTQGFAVESPSLAATVPIRSEKNPFNPFTGPTKLTYSLSKDANISVYILNIRGEKVWQYDAPAGTNGGRAGDNDITWDGITFNAYASNGVYLVRLTARVGGEIKTLSTTKIALIKE